MWLALLVWFFTAGIVYLFASKYWWLPAPISEHAVSFDSHFAILLLVVGAIFVCAQGALGYAVLRFKDDGGKAKHSTGNHILELLWTSITAVVFVGFAMIASNIWAGVHLERSGDADLRVEVLAKQFSWSFRYAGPDGTLGRTDPRFISDSSGNPFGVDEKDPAGKDDIISGALRVPRGALVELSLRSRDMIHSFFVRELRLKQDLVPGMVIPLRFRADKVGIYEVPCSELCGLGHHQMRTTLIVMTPQEYKQWLADEERKPR